MLNSDETVMWLAITPKGAYDLVRKEALDGPHGFIYAQEVGPMTSTEYCLALPWVRALTDGADPIKLLATIRQRLTPGNQREADT